MRGRKPETIVAGSSAIVGTLKAPAWLSKDAKAEWKRVAPILIDERKTLTLADLGALENLCVAIGRVREIERQIQLSPLDLDPKLFRMQDKAIQTSRQLQAELGLTPVSRSRPAIREDDRDDDVSPLDL